MHPIMIGLLYFTGVLSAAASSPPCRWEEAVHAQSSCTVLLQTRAKIAIGQEISKDREAQDTDVNIIPAPVKLERRSGFLSLGERPRVMIKGPAGSVSSLKKFVLSELGVGEHESAPVQVSLDLSPENTSFGSEGYELEVTKHKVRLHAKTEHGHFNGLMTLKQLFQRSPAGDWRIPAVLIHDQPALQWRGLMLDVSRHFFPKEDVERLLKTMALYKLNHFHWHLTDDQGWRFPVEKYPKLISLGSYRKATQRGHDTNSDDGTPYNGSYTVEEIEDIVSLANSLHIQVVPEFDLPGHSEAAISAYPEFGNSDIGQDWKPEVATKFGALPYTLSPKEESLGFAKDILTELAVLFPNSSYIHIGGDEVSTGQWSRSESALQVAREKNLGESQLEGMMIEGAAGHLRGLHRRPIVWDEAMQSGAKLPAGTVVMLWRSWEGIDNLGNRASERNLPVVLAPQDHTYLDQWQSPDGQGEKYDAIGGYLPLSKVYETQVHAGSAQVLGIQAQLWSEYIREGGKNLDYMAWPRGCALAEAAWAGDRRPGFEDFQQRLQRRTADFQQLHVNYRELSSF
eukprot:TRINITY_DN2108_c0_g2_i1.p1 TRINITY_DN2108_c0_g2~~TRINITY_DN2108_c0_g2_i1.p1  ORF type:complete len:569 (-),score=105.19 TRINITY_DN2108_c0_g2_i1:11-1717(-)